MAFGYSKGIRRRLLLYLYERYQNGPLDVVPPDELVEGLAVEREELWWNAHYLGELGLVELMIGYSPRAFDAIRISPHGMDLVENRTQFDRRFPAAPEGELDGGADLAELLERLAEETDLSDLGAPARESICRDIRYLREELFRPVDRWREEVVRQVLQWVGESARPCAAQIPSIEAVRREAERVLADRKS